MDDLSGQKFARLIVIKRMNNNKYRQSMWLCRCNCGKEKVILGSSLRSGRTKSCGCLHDKGNNTKHSHSKKGKESKTYISWLNMIQRCTNPNNKDYHNYGERGIKVCARWLKFENFLEDMGEHPGKGYSIDRINNNGNYCKSNCRWATNKEQSRNTSRTRLITYNGKTQCLKDWAEEYSIPYHVLKNRIILGWSMQKALTTPVKKYKKRSA